MLLTVLGMLQFTSNFYALIGQNLTGEFMCTIYAASGNFPLIAVMFLTVFFHWMYKMKYSCYEDSSVIQGLVYLLGCPRFRFSPCLMRKRVEKSQAMMTFGSCISTGKPE